jgi:hypothetical protein
MSGQANPNLLPRWFCDIYCTVHSDQVDWLLSILWVGKEILFCYLKVQRVREGLQAAHTRHVDPSLQAPLGIDALVGTNELDFTLKKIYLEVFIQRPSSLLNVKGCALAQRRGYQMRKMVFHFAPLTKKNTTRFASPFRFSEFGPLHPPTC